MSDKGLFYGVLLYLSGAVFAWVLAWSNGAELGASGRSVDAFLSAIAWPVYFLFEVIK